MNKNLKKTVSDILSRLFPLEGMGKTSVLMQQSWLQKNTQDLYIKDLIWSKR